MNIQSLYKKVSDVVPVVMCPLAAALRSILKSISKFCGRNLSKVVDMVDNEPFLVGLAAVLACTCSIGIGFIIWMILHVMKIL